MSATQKRDQAAGIAASDNASALRIAREIEDPWFRCQALAHVAWPIADHKRFFAVFAESLQSGWSLQNTNRSVTVIAWPVAALALRNYPGPDSMGRSDRELREVIARLTKAISGEPSPASRADALLLHVHALSPTRPELREGILGLLVKECRDPANRKRQRQLDEAAQVIAPDDPDAARGLIALLDETRRHRTTERIEGRWQGLGPRPFFELIGTRG